ncbi:MAG: response regulator [Deltaproteobacteria bacterium]|nr:response regulator [Deltaproteobacteria bacterium]
MAWASIESGTGGKLRILVAEDDDDLRELLVRGLEVEGHHVVELEDGFELGDYLAVLHTTGSKKLRPDVILTDVRMPGRTGLEVLREAREQGLTCPVIVLSAYADRSMREAARELEPMMVLAKPVEVDFLIGLVAKSARR